MKITNRKAHVFYVVFISVAFFGAVPIALAEHEAMVAGHVVPLSEASLSHGKNCDDVHYHGELNGVPDPAPDGCGHGVVTILAHNEEGESIVPDAVMDDMPSGAQPSSAWGRFTDWLDVLFQGISGGFSPKTVEDSVEIVEDSVPSIKENTDNANEYFDAYEDAPSRERYTLETENPKKNAPLPSLYKRFWRLFE